MNEGKGKMGEMMLLLLMMMKTRRLKGRREYNISRQE